MLFDRVLRLGVRNFSTLFLVIFMVIFPLHLVYAFFFHDVFAVRELHPAIADFPPNRQVKGVGQDHIAQARIWFWILVAVEAVLIPLLLRAVRRVLVLDQQGAVPDATTAWRTSGQSEELADVPNGSRTGAAVGAIVTGVVVGALVWLSLARVSDLLPDDVTAFAVAVTDAASRAAGGAFALVGVAVGRSGRAGRDSHLRL